MATNQPTFAKTYFLIPPHMTPPAPPPNGPLRLGSVLSSPATPLPVLSNGVDAVGVVVERLDSNVKWSHSTFSSGGFGLWTEFLSCLGVGVDINVEKGLRVQQAYEFASMHTQEFTPTKKFVMDVIGGSSEIQERLYRARNAALLASRSVSMYMVTGIKSVSGAKILRSQSRGLGVGVQVGVDVSVLSGGGPAPFLCPRWDSVKEGKEQKSSDGGDDFVFAFRVVKIVVKVKPRTLSIGSKVDRQAQRGFEVGVEEYSQGAMYEVGAAREVDNGEHESVIEDVVVDEAACVTEEELGQRWMVLDIKRNIVDSVDGTVDAAIMCPKEE